MDYPEITLEISDKFELKTLFSYSVEETIRIGKNIAETLHEYSPVMLRRDDTHNILSLLARPKTGKTYLAHAIANAFTEKTQPDFQSDFINRELPAWSIWRKKNMHISNSDSILEEWGQCAPPPPSLLPSTFKMVEHANAETQLISTMLISMEKTEDTRNSPRKLEVYINPRCNVARHILNSLSAE